MLMDADSRIRPAIKVGFRILGATSARDHTIANNMTLRPGRPVWEDDPKTKSQIRNEEGINRLREISR
jgi:hypothetical protein